MHSSTPHRSLLTALIALALVGVAGPLRADTDLGPVIASGEIELGYQGVSDDFRSAKFDQYRDEGPGFIGAGHFLLLDPDRRHFFEGEFDSVTRDDQEYFGRFGRFGQYDVVFGMSQFSQTFSNNALSPYCCTTFQGLPAGWPGPFPTSPGTGAFETALETFSGRQPLKFRQRDYFGGGSFWANDELLLSGRYELRDRDGTRPGAIQFGSPGGRFVNYAKPVDDHTHSWLGSGALVKDAWTLDFDYRGSWYDNHARSVFLENPTLQDDPAPLGRISQAPDNTAHNFSLSGSVAVPADFPLRVSGTVAYGMHRQDDSFLPISANPDPVAVNPLLPESSLDGEVETLLGNFVVTARPSAGLNVKGRYRFYNYYNRTDTIVFPERVRNDAPTAQVEPDAGLPFVADQRDHRRQNASVSATQRLTSTVKATAEVDWDNWYREDREVSHLNDYGGKVTFDFRPDRSVWMRTSYEYRTRSGNSYRSMGGAPATLRMYDVADRRLQVLDASTTWIPLDALSVRLTGKWTYANFQNKDFGLDGISRYSSGVDVGYQLSEAVGLSAYYTFDRTRNTQNVQNGDWTGRNTDKAHDVGATVDVVMIPDKLNAEVSYQYHWGKAQLRANGASAVDFPSIKDNLSVFSILFDYRLLDNLRLKTGYRFERWNGTNFQYDDLGLIPPDGATADVVLANSTDDFEAHIISSSVVFEF